MYTKFYEEFTRMTNGSYKMIKLSSAKYEKAKNLLTVNFIISAFEVSSFDDAQKNGVAEAIRKMFPGVKVAVTYTRTYADSMVVTNKVMEYLYKSSQMIFRSLKESDVSVRVTDDELFVTVKLTSTFYQMFMEASLESELKDYLECLFTQAISVRAEEVADSNEGGFEFVMPSATKPEYSDLRLITVDVGEKLMARGKTEGVSQMPSYISDVKKECQGCVLCGKLSNISKRFYNNKKYSADNPKNGPEKLPLIRFMIDDTTGKMECTCFPRFDEADALETTLYSAKEVVCVGDVSRYNGNLSMTASAVFACTVDYDSIKESQGKPAPKEYNTVYPENCLSVSQQSFIDEEEKVSSFLKGKTLVIFDLETTSTSTETAEIIQLSALKVVDGVEKQTFTTFVKPTKSIPKEIVELTSIDDGMVANAPRIADVIPDFFKFTQNSVLVGHNIIGYDFPIINRVAGDMGYKFKNELIDTLTLSRVYLKEMSNHKLTTLSKALKLEHENAHRADADVLATWGVLKEIARRMDG